MRIWWPKPRWDLARALLWCSPTQFGDDMTNNLFYEVLHISSREARLTARFRTLADAQRYVKTHEATGPWDIVTPAGRRIRGRRMAADALAARREALLADTLPTVRRDDRGAA